MRNRARKSKLISLLSALVGLFLGLFLSYVNNNHDQNDYPARLLEEEEEEEDEIDPVLEFTILSCIVLLLIFLTILFELLKDHVEEHASSNAKPIVEALFGELTVLGFLSVFTFIFTNTGVFQRLGERLLGPARHEDVLEAFESVHYTIFFIMVFFVIQVLVLVKEASQTEKMWLEYERSVVSFNAEHNNEQQHSLNSLGAPPVYPASLSATGIVLRWIQSYGERLPLTGQHVLLFFKALRDEFVLDRELEHPFQPSTKKMDKDFNFGRYLGVCQSILLQKVVHVKIFTWVLFALGVVVYYLFVLLVDCNPTILAWTWVTLAWLLCLYNIHFEHHLITVIKAFASKTVYYLAHNGQEERSQGDESSALLEPHDHLLPDWCHIDVQEYIRNRSWWTRAIAGHGVPNRQQALYWMDRKGPPLYLFILQFDLLFVGIFAAMQCMYVGPFMHHHKPHWQFVVYLVLAVVPILNIVVNKRRLVAVLTPVCSLGFYRRPQVIANVIRENKTIQGIRTFIVVYKLRRLAQQATTLSSHVDTPTVHYSELFDPHEIEEVAKVFGEFDLDGSGSITYDEFEKLMSNQGALLTKEQLHNMISSLDTDKSGAVDKEEFIQWYANHAQDDDISEQEFAHFMFHVFDENDSGEITIGEFKKKLEQVSKRFTVDEIGMLVNELDSNNDGTICQEEFEELIHKYYPKELSRSQRAH